MEVSKALQTNERWQCAACGCMTAPKTADLSSVGMDTPYKLATCVECHTQSTYPLPSDQTVKEYYSHSFDYRWYRDHLPAKQRDASIRTQEILNSWPETKTGQFLDFGGGLGYQSQAFRNRGLDCQTWDPYATGLHSSLPSNISTVICLHVLEHAISPSKMIDAIRSTLKPNGHLIIAVPNRDGLGYEHRGMEWTWAQPPICHIHHFTTNGLRRLLERSGFTVLEIVYKDRWDANYLADDRFRSVFAILGRLWGSTPMLSRLTVYRRAVASLTSTLRFLCLRLSARLGRTGDAELMIHAIRSIDGSIVKPPRS